MKVRKSSWHYRLWRVGRSNPDSEPRDLCRYFWHIMLLKVLVPAVIAGFVLLGVGALVWVIVRNPVEAALATSAASILVASVIGLVVLIKATEPRRAAKKKAREFASATAPPKPPKEPSLLWEFIKAKKRKACPLIDVVDES